MDEEDLEIIEEWLDEYGVAKVLRGVAEAVSMEGDTFADENLPDSARKWREAAQEIDNVATNYAPN